MRPGSRLTSSRLVCRPAACARRSRADQPLPPPGSLAVHDRVDARGTGVQHPRSGGPQVGGRGVEQGVSPAVVEHGPAAAGPLDHRIGEGRHHASQRPDPGRVDAQPRALGQDEGAVLVVADGTEHRDREGRPEHAQVDGHVQPGSAGAQARPARSWQVIQGRIGVNHLPGIDEDRPGAQDPVLARPGSLIRHAARDRSPRGRPRGCAGERSRPSRGHRGRRGRHPRDSARPAGPAAAG